MYISDRVSLKSHYIGKHFRKSVVDKIKTHVMFNSIPKILPFMR